MQKYFELRPSQTERFAVYAMLLLAAILALIYLNPGMLQTIYLLAIVLLAVGEGRVSRGKEHPCLVFEHGRCGWVTTAGQQPYFSSKNKVYRCRWFAILKLYDRHKSRTEILFPDRFKSIQAYQECRFLLSRMQDS